LGINIKHKQMRKVFFAALFISLTLNLTAQDTLFVRNGQKIPAVIVEKNDPRSVTGSMAHRHLKLFIQYLSAMS